MSSLRLTSATLALLAGFSLAGAKDAGQGPALSAPLLASGTLTPSVTSLELPAATWIKYLSGKGPEDAVLWDFFCTEGRRSGSWSTIRVPSCWEQEGFGTYNYGMTVRDKPDDFPGLAREQGRYRTRFVVPEAWSGRSVRIVFEGVMTDAEVRVNGVLAGPVHQGAFYRFRYDLSDVLQYGAENVVEVLVSKESANRSVNEAERRGDYWNFGGIFRPVFLEALPSSHIERIAVDARADGSLAADVFVRLAKAASKSTVTGELLDATGKSLVALPSSSFSKTKEGFHLAHSLKGIMPWTAETPALYTLRVNLATDGGIQHSITERIGFRTFEVRKGDGLYLNGSRIVMKGVNRHAFRAASGRTLSAADDLQDVKLIRGMNMNAVRMSHYPPDKSFLEACDEQGLYVLDELGGWHGLYDTSVGRSLIAEMVTRDVNHASVLFWDNGNEMGWNVENDGEFARWDPQARPVLHPLGVFNGLNTFHYRSYAETEHFLAGEDLFMPTEFLHGLYDGGHGAGLYDYWQLMRKHPRSAGGFLWVYADEGIARSDQDGKIDCAGSFAPDGIVGPRLEREGSYETIREVWSPIVVGPVELPPGFSGTLQVENRYDFLNLDQCSFKWSLVSFSASSASASGHTALFAGVLRGPSVPAGKEGSLVLPLPNAWRDADALLVSALDPSGREVWTQSWSWKTLPLRGIPTASSSLSANSSKVFVSASPSASASRTGLGAVIPRDDGVQYAASIGNLDIRWDKDSGELATVLVDGRLISLAKGPRLLAAHRRDRNLDGSPVSEPVEKDLDRHYTVVDTRSKLVSITQRTEGDSVLVDVVYDGPLRRATWRLTPDQTLYLDYQYEFAGVVDLLGVTFAYPEAKMRSVRWLGLGPYRVWQNRLHGTTLDLWSNTYNDSIPGESFFYPEFKGYFRGWHWASFTTSEGSLSLGNASPASFLGVYTPKDGGPAPHLCVLPAHDLGVFDVIPAMRNKVNKTELVGPSSQPQSVSGLHKGSLSFRFSSN